MQRHLIGLILGGMLLPAISQAQEWAFMSFWPDGKPWAMGSLKLTEPTPGTHRARVLIPGGGLDDCWRGETGATVERQQDQVIVYMHPRMRGCSEIRFVLKADGSGGRKEDKQADGSWLPDGRERDLKRR